MTSKTWTLDRRDLLGGLCLAVVVGVLAYGCMAFASAPEKITPIWFANAVVVATLLRTRPRRWPALVAFALAGGAAANLVAGLPPLLAFGLAACNAAEYLCCAAVLRHFCGPDFDIARTRHLVGFLGASVGASVLAATVASGLLALHGEPNVLRGLLVWIQADLLGLLTVTPALLVLSQPMKAPIVWRETWTLALLAAVTGYVFFVAHYPLVFVVSATLALPTWRMGLPGAVAGFLIIAVIGTVAALTGDGPIMMQDSAVQIIGLQIFLTVSFLSSVPLAAARDEGERLKWRLRGALDAARTAHGEAAKAAAVKSEFLANMSHELRTPLTSVLGFTRLAAEQPELSPLSRAYVDRVSEASRALLCAVNDILDFSKLEAGQVSFRPQPVAVASLTRTTLDLFAPQAGAKDLALRLVDDTPADLVIAVDPDRLRQVLLNLVGNAVKFTQAGEVAVRAAYDEAGQRLSIRVRDTGPGIPPDHLDRLFKRFSQVDGSLTRDYGGTGLGLAICKGIVEAMGGEIGVTSTPGEGSVFWFNVPAPRTERAAEQAGAEQARIPTAGVSVLVTDDHPANRELVQLFLAAVGARVVEAPDGETAVALAAQQAFDVILMDLRMPRLDGASALQQIRAAPGPNRTTPILAFTADAEHMSEDGLRSQGFDGAVAKPVDPGQLIAAISDALVAAPAAGAGVASAA